MPANSLLRRSCFKLAGAERRLLKRSEAAGSKDLATLRLRILKGKGLVERESQSVPFAEAYRVMMQEKAARSPRTLQDIRSNVRRLLTQFPQLAQRSLRGLSTQDCARMLQASFGHSATQFKKARANLSGISTTGLRYDWCAYNPVTRIPIPRIVEKEIEALSVPQVQSLLTEAQRDEHRACLAPLLVMLYAGVRPQEVSRLRWADVDLRERVVYLAARHSKTGGGRHIPLPAAAARLMRRTKSQLEKEAREWGSAKIPRGDGDPHAAAQPIDSQGLCPRNWARRWARLRQDSGFDSWTQDVLRHTYASYHMKFYGDLSQLQLNMGHRNAQLLLTRYINLRGISRQSATSFWGNVPFHH